MNHVRTGRRREADRHEGSSSVVPPRKPLGELHVPFDYICSLANNEVTANQPEDQSFMEALTALERTVTFSFFLPSHHPPA